MKNNVKRRRNGKDFRDLLNEKFSEENQDEFEWDGR